MNIEELFSDGTFDIRNRSGRDENVISLILHIWRNLAAIKDKALSGYRSAETIEEANLQVSRWPKLAGR